MLGLILCDRIVVDPATKNLSLFEVFLRKKMGQFPSAPQSMSLFAALTDSEGHGTIQLSCVDLEDGETIFLRSYPFTLPDRHTIHQVLIRLETIRFPKAGWYEFYLSIDGETVAQRKFHAFQRDSIQNGE